MQGFFAQHFMQQGHVQGREVQATFQVAAERPSAARVRHLGLHTLGCEVGFEVEMQGGVAMAFNFFTQPGRNGVDQTALDA